MDRLEDRFAAEHPDAYRAVEWAAFAAMVLLILACLAWLAA